MHSTDELHRLVDRIARVRPDSSARARQEGQKCHWCSPGCAGSKNIAHIAPIATGPGPRVADRTGPTFRTRPIDQRCSESPMTGRRHLSAQCRRTVLVEHAADAMRRVRAASRSDAGQKSCGPRGRRRPFTGRPKRHWPNATCKRHLVETPLTKRPPKFQVCSSGALRSPLS